MTMCDKCTFIQFLATDKVIINVRYFISDLLKLTFVCQKYFLFNPILHSERPKLPTILAFLSAIIGIKLTLLL